MKKYLLILILILPFSANAKIDHIVNCKNCSTESDMYNEAVKNSELDKWKNIVIFNSSSEKYISKRVLKYKVRTCETNSEPDGRGGKLKICRYINKYIYNDLKLSTQETSYIKSLIGLSYSFSIIASNYGEIEVPETIIDSAWEIHSSSGARIKLENYYSNEYWGYAAANVVITNLFSILNKLAGTAFDTGDYITMLTADGGKLHFKIQFKITNPSNVTFVFLGGEDAEGNEIAISRALIKSGIYSFYNESNLKSFENALSRFGLKVVRGSGSKITRGKVRVVDCVDDECLHPF